MTLRERSKASAQAKTTAIRPRPTHSSNTRINSKGQQYHFYFDNKPFFFSQMIFLWANLSGYIFSNITSAHYHVDLLGTGAFAVMALTTLRWRQSTADESLSIRHRLSAFAVIIWSIRLASFLLYRVIQKNGHDHRLDDILSSPYYGAGFWIFSWLWGAMVSLPHTLGLTSSQPGPTVAVWMGFAIFAIGWIIETVADYQKWTFKQVQQQSSHGSIPFCNVGLWSLTQHPNWLGDIVLWIGIWLMNAPALLGPQIIVDGDSSLWRTAAQRYGRVFLSCMGPCFLTYLLYGQATGRILPDALEETRHRYGYGIDEAYTDYIDQTPLLFPFRHVYSKLNYV